MIGFRFGWAVAFLFLTVSASAQDVLEAYNLSNMNAQATARSIGFGGALGSVGGDFGAVSVNPAGLGIYRSSEISFTPSIKINSSASQYLTENSNDNNTKANINHFSVVFNNAPKGKRYDRHAWKSVSFAMGMNRLADFNHNYNYTGANYSGSASQAFEADANKDTINVSIPGRLAYTGFESYLINGYQSHYNTVVPFAQGIQQLNNVTERGGITEYSLSLGGNYKEKLLTGISVGIPFMDYRSTAEYSETILPKVTNNPEQFQSFTYHNALNISGGGINAKFGAIYNVTNFFRVGGAFHTPTIYSIKEFSDYGIVTKINGRITDISTDNYLPRTNFDYSFISPYKAILSATFILKKFGFITADYEYVAYNTMHYSYPKGFDSATGTSYDYQAALMNKSIRNTYRSVTNLRLGAEIKLTKFFMIRAGVGYYGNPYNASSVSGEHIDISGGLGLRTRHFFADLGMVSSLYSFTEQPYNNIDYNYVRSGPPAPFPTAKIDQRVNNIALTIGTKF